MGENATVIRGEGINRFHALTLLSALSLEISGLRHSRGSVYAHIKRTYGLKGNKVSVYRQFVKLLIDRGGCSVLTVRLRKNIRRANMPRFNSTLFNETNCQLYTSKSLFLGIYMASHGNPCEGCSYVPECDFHYTLFPNKAKLVVVNQARKAEHEEEQEQKQNNILRGGGVL